MSHISISSDSPTGSSSDSPGDFDAVEFFGTTVRSESFCPPSTSQLPPPLQTAPLFKFPADSSLPVPKIRAHAGPTSRLERTLSAPLAFLWGTDRKLLYDALRLRCELAGVIPKTGGKYHSALVWLADQLGVPAYAPVYSKFEAASALNDAIKHHKINHIPLDQWQQRLEELTRQFKSQIASAPPFPDSTETQSFHPMNSKPAQNSTPTIAPQTRRISNDVVYSNDGSNSSGTLKLCVELCEMKQLLILQVNQQERHAQQMRKDLHVLNENIDRILGCMRQPKGNVDQIAQIEAQIQHAHAETQRILQLNDEDRIFGDALQRSRSEWTDSVVLKLNAVASNSTVAENIENHVDVVADG